MTEAKVVTIGSLYKKDLKDAYFLPSWPSTFIQEEYRFYNDLKYKLYDWPPESRAYQLSSYPFRHLPAAGNEIPVLMDIPPPSYLVNHWKTWLPAIPLPNVKSIDEGLRDEVPIITVTAIQDIPADKQSIHPDIMHKLQLKSTIAEIGVPYPLYMNESNIQYPCIIKIDHSCSGLGTTTAKNKDELAAALNEIREEHGWKEGVVFQEVIRDVKEVPSFQFHLHRSGEIYWVGTTVGWFSGFHWTGAEVDWNENSQGHYKDLVWDMFVVPVAKYLHKHDYFGLVTIEVIITHRGGMYLCDVNPRIGGDTTHLLLAPYMAQLGYKHSCLETDMEISGRSAETIVEKANGLNCDDIGRVIVISATDNDEGCLCCFSVYAKSPQEAYGLLEKFKE